MACRRWVICSMFIWGGAARSKAASFRQRDDGRKGQSAAAQYCAWFAGGLDTKARKAELKAPPSYPLNAVRAFVSEDFASFATKRIDWSVPDEYRLRAPPPADHTDRPVHAGAGCTDEHRRCLSRALGRLLVLPGRRRRAACRGRAGVRPAPRGHLAVCGAVAWDPAVDPLRGAFRLVAAGAADRPLVPARALADPAVRQSTHRRAAGLARRCQRPAWPGAGRRGVDGRLLADAGLPLAQGRVQRCTDGRTRPGRPGRAPGQRMDGVRWL